jgi:hypothetical protein
VVVTIRVNQAIGDVTEGTEAGEIFKHYLTEGVALAIGSDQARIAVIDISETVPERGTDKCFVTFEILSYDEMMMDSNNDHDTSLVDDDAASAADLATAFVGLVGDPASLVYSVTMEAHVRVDIGYEPVLQSTAGSNPEADNDKDSGVDLAWMVATLTVVAATLGLVALAYVKRRPLSEYLLWRLGAFRFQTLREEHRHTEMGEMRGIMSNHGGGGGGGGGGRSFVPDEDDGDGDGGKIVTTPPQLNTATI